VALTLVVFLLSVIIGAGSLAVGYYQAGLFDPVRWFVLLGVVWSLAHWRRVDWVSPLAFLLAICGAGYGIWLQLTTCLGPCGL
jgi:hypothetical protein